MKILITGSKGFIGKNLITELCNQGYTDLLEYDIDSDSYLLDKFAKECEFVFHLAGVNRPEKQEDFMAGNFGFTSVLTENLKKYNNKAPILITSSTQAILDNPYGQSKKAAEELLFQYGKENDVKVFIYRLTNTFGKWCRPNYNSVVATFCHHISHELPITVHDPDVVMNLLYIDDVVSTFIGNLQAIEQCPTPVNDELRDIIHFERVTPVHTIKLGEIAELLYQFKESRCNLKVPDLNNTFIKKLFSTYLSYLPKDKFSYPLKMNIDSRGSFTEFIKSTDSWQVSVNISKPCITKGNHWHHTKNEKFLVVSGKGVIRFRNVYSEEVSEYYVSGDKLEVVDIPVGYTHNIENLGNTDMVTIMWVNEVFDKDKPDTFYLEV